MVDVPRIVRNKAEAAGASRWLDELPALLRSLEQEWSIRVGEPYADGTEAYVARATTDVGERVVIKLLIPRSGDAAAREIDVLRHADGDGCVALLRDDAARSALLLEELGPSLFRLGVPFAERLRILCDTAARLWRPAPHLDLPTGAEKAVGLSEYIGSMWEETNRPCPERVVEHALACAERRRAAHDDERAHLVHGDVHEWNALQAPDAPDGFKLIDPDGLLAEPEYDLGVLMREDPVELLAAGDPMWRARWLAQRTGLDAAAIWEWGVVERVSTGLLATKIDLQPVGRQMLDTASALV